MHQATLRLNTRRGPAVAGFGLVLAFVLALARPTPAHAQQTTDDPAARAGAPAPSPADASAGLADGEIRKVDQEAKKLTIRHGEIKRLDMPPMTMVFQVKDGAMLDKLKTGDKIRFAAEKAASGFVVTHIQILP